MSIRVTLIVPCYNEVENIPLFVSVCERELQELDWCVLFVNDGSTDGSWGVLRDLAAQDARIHALNFSRNFGHQNAIKAGLEEAAHSLIADAYVMLDADLQHPIELIGKMVEIWQTKGVHVVQGQRDDSESKISLFKKWTSSTYYCAFSWLSGVQMHAGQSDFRLVDQQVMDFIISCRDKDFFLRGLLTWSGFSTYTLKYKPHDRTRGVSKFTLKKMMNLALSGVVGYSVRPLHLALVLGVLSILFSLSYFIYAIGAFCLGGHVSVGWTSLIATILLLCGIQLFILGIMGLYLGKAFMDGKHRPTYIVDGKIP